MSCCTRIVGLLLDYLEGRLDAGTASELERHLRRCPDCVAQLNTYRSTVSLLHSLRDEDLPPELRTTLHAFLDHRTRN
jgi:anti-sigma factor RsiW